jgi:DNA-binding MarR family transcriptional regulator
MEIARPKSIVGADRPRRRSKLPAWQWQATELIHEIVATAERIAAARHPEGALVYRNDARWSLLRAIERSPGCPSISDLARKLRISRQAAHELVTKAERAGQIRLLTNHDDRRILQAVLTPGSRIALDDALRREGEWVFVVLKGLGRHELAATLHIMRVIRQRLARDERALRDAR